MHRIRPILVRRAPPLLGVACLLAWGLPFAALAQGAPRSVAECERLKNDLAYNQCLAMFGPAAKNVGGGDGVSSTSVATALAAIPPGAAIAMPLADESAPEARRGHRGRRSRSVRGGRQTASFTVGGGIRSYRRHRRRH